MRSLFLPSLLLALAAPLAAHADTFTFAANGTAGGFTGSGTLVVNSNGNGTDTITGISGIGIGALSPIGSFKGNDNLLFPTSNSPQMNLLDSNGFSFTDLQGDTGFLVNIYSPAKGTYAVRFLDSDGVTQTLPISLAATPVSPTGVTPEPSSVVLLGTGVLGLMGLVRRRLA